MATLLGVDVSTYQGRIDWRKAKQAGIKFAFIKATEGSTIIDNRLVENRRNARANGIPCGYYHFFRPRSSVKGQINNFVKAIGQLYPGDLPPVIDIEVPDQWQEFTVAQRIVLIKTFIDGVKSALGVDPIIYCSAYFPDDVLGNAKVLANYPLWVAHYTSAPSPRVPAPWQFWTFWQYTDNGRIAGIAGPVDLNRFNGSLEQLAKFQKPGQFPPKNIVQRTIGAVTGRLSGN
ncbi:MAG: glycoside hydrolase family 25 protein [Candidatus Melainabacteria bacterium]|nr:glycoside hydrolase family 25 protein [Candidatus Melainabacteria bacterium]